MSLPMITMHVKQVYWIIVGKCSTKDTENMNKGEENGVAINRLSAVVQNSGWRPSQRISIRDCFRTLEWQLLSATLLHRQVLDWFSFPFQKKRCRGLDTRMRRGQPWVKIQQISFHTAYISVRNTAYQVSKSRFLAKLENRIRARWCLLKLRNEKKSLSSFYSKSW